MNATLGELLPLAVAVLVSPIPLIAVILLLLSPGVGRTRLAFVVGWVLGIAVTTGVFAVLASIAGLDANDDSGSSGTPQVVLGVVLLWLALRQWRKRPKPGEAAELPGWMRALDRFTPARAFSLGAGLTVVNPKNLVLCAAAGSIVGSAGLALGEAAVEVIAFTAIAACGVVGIVVVHAVTAERTDAWLGELRHWLEANNHAVMAVILLVMGAVVLGKGLGGV